MTLSPTLPDRATTIADACRLSSEPEVYSIGQFDDRVTVLSQQCRALNLAWALVETGRLSTDPAQKRSQVAILGGGFAGLTFAAALLQKQCHCSITVFEERDTLLPLQQGSDTRWLHPHIYDWPVAGSDAPAAMLPVLNWTAARASDVVVQVLSGWGEVARDRDPPVTLWCNTRHLQFRGVPGSKARLEWVGERRDPATGRSLARQPRGHEGRSARFDVVVLAVGFGLEAIGSSYWRNEILGQPGLEQSRTTYLVSGQGDGAMIDLLRLKISQFRQDRILAELFGGKPELVDELRRLRDQFLADSHFSLYEAFGLLLRRGGRRPAKRQMEQALDALVKRLRRDTEVILQLKPEVRTIADLLSNGVLKASFQNALLVYMLYRCGGFTPGSGQTEIVAERFKVNDRHIIRRHGTDRLGQLKRLLPAPLYDRIEKARAADSTAFQQSAEIQWSGGYFGTPGRAQDFSKLTDEERAVARKEYLPGPTGLLANSVAGAVAGHLVALCPTLKHLRVTLHRVITIHGENLLQQACDYVGVGPLDGQPTSGRVFPADVATIGLAYRTRRIVRSKPKVSHRDLDTAMKQLELSTASRKMARGVQFVAALPVLQPEDSHFAPSPVCAVLYLDSRDEAFDLSDAEFADLAGIVSRAIEAARNACEGSLDRLDNTALRIVETSAPAPMPLPPEIAGQIMIVDVEPPLVGTAFALNIDHSDLTPITN